MRPESMPPPEEANPPCTDRRTFARQGLAGALALASWGLPGAAQAATQVRAVETDLRSDNERMISYRHQQHLWQTPDGALHLLFNRGTLTPGPGLTVFSSTDGGTTWRLMLAFPETDDKSTGDVLAQGTLASIVHHTQDFKLQFTHMSWDSATAGWTLLQQELAYASGQFAALNPTLTVDDLGTVWVGFLCRNRFSNVGNLRVVNRVGGGNVWTDPNLVFGPTDNRSVERSARMVRIAGGTGMVWTVREQTFWSTRQVAQPDNSAWTSSVLFTGAVTKPLEDPYASHFNVATDGQGGLHFITIENFDVLHFALAPSGTQWVGPVQADDTRKVAYAQMGFANGRLCVSFSVQRGKGTVTQSSNGGETWLPAYDLALLPAAPGINYNTARIEAPGWATGIWPVLQQYEDNGVQRLMLFKIPA